MRPHDRRGYTLIELIVTVLLIGILASFAIPQYLKTVESGKADDAVAITNMIGTTNKMFALDHGGYYVSGQFTASCTQTYGAPPCTGGAAQCPTGGVVATQTNACILVCCKYLADQDWANKAYNFYACDGGTPGACAGQGSGNQVAGASRLASANAPYKSWAYTMNTGGVITAYGAAPPPTY